MFLSNSNNKLMFGVVSAGFSLSAFAACPMGQESSCATPQEIRAQKLSHIQAVRDASKARSKGSGLPVKPAGVLPGGTTLTMQAKYGMNSISFGASYLWGIDGNVLDADQYIDKVKSSDASIVSSFSAPDGSGWNGNLGIAYANSKLWLINSFDDLIYQVDPNSGKTLGSMDVNESDVTAGFAFDGTSNFYYGVWDYDDVSGGAEVKKITTNGSLVDSFHLAGIQVIYDIAYVNGELYIVVSDFSNNNYFYHVNAQTHELIEKFDRDSCEDGLAFDGTDKLWSADWCDLEYTIYPIGGGTQKHSLTVTKTGNGSGTVISNPSGINCGTGGTDCIASYDDGEKVILTANSAMSSNFTAWSGDCTGTKSTCSLTMSKDYNVTALFKKAPRFPLTVVVTPQNQGTVTSDLTGINCGQDCWQLYSEGTQVTLTAKPQQGYMFAGWSWDCKGTGTCAVNLTQPRVVFAKFRKK